ncbi:MAG: SAM-dependent DNA methyltransferase, partial [Gammaproteobacteria bacterium]|nr:SAM-dependent DNA methyltransferase [Gammaproteobacteria bacterium]
MNELEQGLKYQDGINNALSAACSSFRGTVSVDRYKNLILSMLFLKYLSDIWQDYYGDYESVYDSEQELIEDKRVNLKFYLPCEANFYNLYQHRHQPGNGMRINWAFHILEKVNGPQLKDDGISVFQHRSFITHEFGEGKQIDPIFCRLLEDFAIPELILKPSRIGAFDVVGRAFEYLLEHFAVSV